eukprot:gene12153-12239_t
MGYDLSVNLEYMFHEAGDRIEDRVAAAAAAGFTLAEIFTTGQRDVPALAAALSSHGVGLLSVVADPRTRLIDPETHEGFRALFRRAAEDAVALGCRRIVVGSGPGAPYMKRAVQLKIVADAVASVVPIAEELNVVIMLEAVNTRVDHPGVLFSRTVDATDVIGHVASPRVRLLYDIYHSIAEGEDPFAVAPDVAHLIEHVQIADAPGRGEPGSGTVDWPAILTLLRDVGYDGAIGVECSPTRTPTADALAHIRDLAAPLLQITSIQAGCDRGRHTVLGDIATPNSGHRVGLPSDYIGDLVTKVPRKSCTWRSIPTSLHTFATASPSPLAVHGVQRELASTVSGNGFLRLGRLAAISSAYRARMAPSTSVTSGRIGMVARVRCRDLLVAAPQSLTIDAIRAFAVARIGWIRTNQRKLQSQPREPAREYVDRESHYVWGERVLLKVQPYFSAPYVRLDHRVLTLCVLPSLARDERHQIVEAWYRDILRAEAIIAIKTWQDRLGVRAGDLFIQRMKTKWGSCSPRTGNIRLNTELAKKPRTCLDYVVLHELAHLVEPTHSPAFRTILDRHMPHWRDVRNLLNSLPLSTT